MVFNVELSYGISSGHAIVAKQGYYLHHLLVEASEAELPPPFHISINSAHVAPSKRGVS